MFKVRGDWAPGPVHQQWAPGLAARARPRAPVARRQVYPPPFSDPAPAGRGWGPRPTVDPRTVPASDRARGSSRACFARPGVWGDSPPRTAVLRKDGHPA